MKGDKAVLTVFILTEAEVRSKDAEVEELIIRMSRSDMSGMGELYELISTDVYSYALSKTASKESAEDITHDTFVQLWKNATQYKPMGKPLAWVFTIEINLIRRLFNKSKRFIPFDEAIETEGDGVSLEDGIADNDFVRRVLSLLNEDEREIVTLHIVSGLKHREIAKLLKKPLSTVLSKYNRAIKKLQIQIKKKEGQ